jgi:hypothetical protein
MKWLLCSGADSLAGVYLVDDFRMGIGRANARLVSVRYWSAVCVDLEIHCAAAARPIDG